MADARLQLIIEAQNRAGGTLRQVKGQVAELGGSGQSALTGLAAGFGTVGKALTVVGGGVAAVLRLFDSLGSVAMSALRSILAPAMQVVRVLEQMASRSLTQVVRGLEQVGKAAVVAGAALATLGARDAIKFDEGMRNVNSIAQLSEKEFQNLRRAVVEVAKDPGITDGLDVLARGLYDIQSSGFAGATALGMLRTSGRLASAGLSTTAESAKVLAAVMNAYQFQTVKDATRVADVLQKTVVEGVVTMDQLAQSFANATTTGAKAGISVEDVGAAFASMTLTGWDAAEASTALARGFQAFTNPTKPMKAAIKTAGFESGVAMLKVRGLGGAMQWLTEATGDDIEKMTEWTGDIRAQRMAASLTGDRFQQMLKTFGSGTVGSVGSALSEQQKSFMFRWKKFTQDLRNRLSLMMEPAVQKLADWFFPLAERAKDFLAAFSATPQAQAMLASLNNILGNLWERLAGNVDPGAMFARIADGVQVAISAVERFVTGGGLDKLLVRFGELQEAARAWAMATVRSAAFAAGYLQAVWPRVVAGAQWAWTQIGAGIEWLWDNFKGLGTMVLNVGASLAKAAVWATRWFYGLVLQLDRAHHLLAIIANVLTGRPVAALKQSIGLVENTKEIWGSLFGKEAQMFDAAGPAIEAWQEAGLSAMGRFGDVHARTPDIIPYLKEKYQEVTVNVHVEGSVVTREDLIAEMMRAMQTGYRAGALAGG